MKEGHKVEACLRVRASYVISYCAEVVAPNARRRLLAMLQSAVTCLALLCAKLCKARPLRFSSLSLSLRRALVLWPTAR